MSKKYVIEIKPEYEDNFKGLMLLGAKDSNLFVDTLAVDELEELNSDYINEHFGSLQDDAYQRGLEDGKQVAVGAAELREKLEYQKGFKDGKAIHDKGCEGCKYGGTPQGDSQCFNCSNYYKNNWTAKDDKIEVGDEVTNLQLGVNFVVTHLWKNNYGEMGVSGFNGDCSAYSATFNKVKKTGRHFDIASILEGMKS